MGEPWAGLLNIVGVPVVALLIAAWSIWLERRLLGLWQDRYGPNRAGPFGLLQVVADMIKIFTKEDWVAPFADRVLFVIAPMVILFTALAAFGVVPITPHIGIADLNVGVLFVLAATALGVYSAIVAGWASNNKYALLGSLRASAQVLSYEVFMGLSLMGVVVTAGSFDLRTIVQAQQGLWFCIPQFLGLIVFTIAGLVETHRLPFDLPEAESELISGYYTEYSGMKFGLFFVGEYLGVTLVSALIVVLFFGGWSGPWLPPLLWFLIKLVIVISFFVLLRASLPRPRYDQLMAYGWKVLLPLTLLDLLVTGAFVVAGASG